MFFSSDRDGSYDIWFARMNPDGSFQTPVKMDINQINTSDPEMYPVLFYGWDSNYTTNFLYISFVREISFTSYVYTYRIDNNFSNAIFNSSVYHPYILTSLALYYQNSYTYLCMLDSYGPEIRSHYYDPYAGESWNLSYTNALTLPLSGIYSMNIHQEGNNAFTSKVILFEASDGNHHQLFLNFDYRRNSPPAIWTQTYPVLQYKSSYNDRWPYVDFPDDAKVYFSSQRGENGDYDLYRYNTITLSNIIPVNPYETTNQVQR